MLRHFQFVVLPAVCGIAAFLLITTPAFAQSEAEHLSHHPELAAQAPVAAPATPVAPPAPAGMMGGMAEMMKNMGLPTKREFYPSLVQIPNTAPERWAEIQQAAHARMTEGLGRLSQGLGSLSAAVDADNFALMQNALAEMREGIKGFESGLSAHRLLAEGEPPRNIALNWFKTEMNLRDGVPVARRGVLGFSLFHVLVMIILSLFSATMIFMYFFKMRRAEVLFGRLDPDTNPRPPGGPLATAAAVAAPASASPVTANWKGKLRIGSIVTETPNLKTFRLLSPSSDHLLPFTFIPGQFLNVSFWIGGAKMNRSYSIASSPRQSEYVELAIRREPRGAVSRHTNDLLKVGDQIEVGGPVGRFTFTGTEADSIVLVSAGVGITPMMSITRYLVERNWPGEIFFIFSCRNPDEFIFAEESAALQRVNPKLHVAVTVTKPEGTDWKGPRGRLTKEFLTQTVPNLPSRRIHLCGPPSMMDATKVLLTELGVSPGNVKTESFGKTKPEPVAGITTAESIAPATGPMVTFSKSNKSARTHVDLQSGDSPPRQTILELSEELGIGIEYSCRVGTCGLCKVKLTSGEVDMEVQDSLDATDTENGIILACQAKPKSDVAVEA